MLKVREIIKVINGAEEITLAWNGSTHPICPEDSVEMDAFGDYAVDSVTLSSANGSVYAEVNILTRPVKVSE